MTIQTQSGVRVAVRKEIGALVAALVSELEMAREREFNPAWCWGAACRAISGTSSPSNHSWGLAIDLDAPENPYMTAAAHDDPHPLRKRFANGKLLRSSMPVNASAIAQKYGFRWGGDYTTKPDPMHFEFMGSVEEAKKRTAKLDVIKKEWSDMASKQEIKEAVREVIKEELRNDRQLLAVGEDRSYDPRNVNLKKVLDKK